MTDFLYKRCKPGIIFIYRILKSCIVGKPLMQLQFIVYFKKVEATTVNLNLLPYFCSF